MKKTYKLPCPRCAQENTITLDNIYIKCCKCRFPLVVVRVIKKNGNHKSNKNIGGVKTEDKIIE